MKFIDFFAGVGGFRRGMELSGHKCIGFCEFDKFAVASYTAMHLITDEQKKKLEMMTKNKRQKEILKDEYKNGEWYARDIKEVRGEDVPAADCWCFGSPCQGFSMAGKQLGLNDERSNLYFQIIRLLKEKREEDRPQWLFMENVKGLLSINGGWDFAQVLSEMATLGYDIEWSLLNSKDFGVPQNRERVFIIGHFRKYGRRKVFSFERATSQNHIKQIGKLANANRENPNRYRVYNDKGLAPTIGKMAGGGLQPHIQILGYTNARKISQRNRILKIQSLSSTITATEYKEPLKIAIPVLTPNRVNKRQHGRRFKENGEPMFTLTAQDHHGVLIDDTQGFDGVRFYDTITPTLRCSGGRLKVCIEQESYRIRKLTPKECFRLQGWTDSYFEKAQFVNSDSQLYKQAGNGVTVNVVKAISDNF